MKKVLWFGFVVVLVMAAAGTGAGAAEWRFPVGLSYISGFSDLVDQVEDNLEMEYYDVDTVEGVPVGLFFEPYYQFDDGLGLGIGLGPIIYIWGEDEVLVFDLPLNLNLRFTFMQGAKVTPYVRAGISAHLAGGDYVEGVDPGFVGAFGIEFFHASPVGMGLEAGFDTATLEVDDLAAGNAGETADIQPLGFVIRVFAVF